MRISRRRRKRGEPPANRHGWASQANGKLQAWRPAMGPFGILYDELYFRYCQRVTPVASSLDALRRFPSADVIVDHACKWLASRWRSAVFSVVASHGSAFAVLSETRSANA